MMRSSRSLWRCSAQRFALLRQDVSPLVQRAWATETRRRWFFGAPPTRGHVETRELPNVEQDTLFDVVVDVDNYRNFVPNCSSSIVRDERDEGDGRGSFQAQIRFDGPMGDTTTSNVTYERPFRVKIEASDSTTFDHLVSDFRIETMEDADDGSGCRVSAHVCVHL